MRSRQGDDESFIFEVRNVPRALYKAQGGFVTNGINMTKLDSYSLGGNFVAARFCAEVEAYPYRFGAGACTPAE